MVGKMVSVIAEVLQEGLGSLELEGEELPLLLRASANDPTSTKY